MKRVINTNGVDTTSACFSFLMETQNVIIRDAYFIGPPVWYPELGEGVLSRGNYGAYPIVDGDEPITYQGQAPQPITFMPFSIERDKLTYKVGFESSKLMLTLRPRDTLKTVGASLGSYARGNNGAFSEGVQLPSPYADLYSWVTDTDTGVPGAEILQSMRQSFASTDWYLAPLTMFRFFMPTFGDVTTYGAAVMFRGRISEMTVDRDFVKLTVSSLMEIFSQKVPSQTIQPGNRWAPFNFTTTQDYSGTNNNSGTLLPGGYSWAQLKFTTSGVTPPNEALDEGWAFIQVSGIGSWLRRIYTNKETSGNLSTILFLDPLPINLGSIGVTINYQLWKSMQTSTNPAGPGAGFPYVPQPFTGIS